jgi:predicted DNA-binding transcriptional regulator YafY
MGKVNNALKMLAILRSREKVTRRELARELEVRIREISRYKDDLESAGLSITNIKGKYGGYTLEHKDYLLNLELSNEEEKALDYCIDYLSDKSFPYFKSLKSALHKIKAINPRKNIINTKVPLYTKGAKAKILYEEERRKWLIINDGIINSRKIYIKYINAKGESSERVVQPYGLFTYYDANYFAGMCENKKEIRQFKLMRINYIELLKDKFTKEDFDLNRYLNETMGLFKDKKLNLKLKIEYPYAQDFQEVQCISGESIKDFREDGFIIYEASAYRKDQILNWIMGMGRFCEVLEPKSLRDDISRSYEEILKNIYNRTI